MNELNPRQLFYALVVGIARESFVINSSICDDTSKITMAIKRREGRCIKKINGMAVKINGPWTLF